MRVTFYEPPEAKKAGGLDQAIRSLREYLVASGFEVESGTASPDEIGQADVTHFHGMWQFNFPKLSRACRRSRIPYVVSPHGMLEPWAWRHKRWKKLPYYHLFERPHLQNAARVLATSEQEARNLSRFVRQDRIAVIPLGLPGYRKPARTTARNMLGWERDELVLLYLSRIHPKKGLLLLLRSLSEIAGSMPRKWRLVIVGDGKSSYFAQCLECARSNKAVSSHTEWKGAIWGEEKWAYYQGADLFCLPSFSENFGLALLEACQVGTRILTTPYTPWSFLEGSGSAVLVKPEVESISSGLLSFLQTRPWQDADRQALADLIHARFSWEVVGKQYVQLYESVGDRQELAGSVCAF